MKLTIKQKTEALAVTAQAMREYGQAIRGDWSGFDGRRERDILDNFADAIESPSTKKTVEDWRYELYTCKTGNGHFRDYCDEDCLRPLSNVEHLLHCDWTGEGGLIGVTYTKEEFATKDIDWVLNIFQEANKVKLEGDALDYWVLSGGGVVKGSAHYWDNQ